MAKSYVGQKGFKKFMAIVKGELAALSKNLLAALAAQKTELEGKIDEIAGAEGLDKKLDADKVGVAGGAASLGDDGLVPSDQLPGYVDDVVEMKKSEPATEGEEGVWMVVDPDEGVTETEVDFVKGKIYVDVDTNLSYRWSGTTLVQITSSDMVEVPEEDIQDMWDSIPAENEPEEEPETDPEGENS